MVFWVVALCSAASIFRMKWAAGSSETPVSNHHTTPHNNLEGHDLNPGISQSCISLTFCFSNTQNEFNAQDMSLLSFERC